MNNKTSIIILTYNNLKYTKDCIESIRKYTKENTYEIIKLLDNKAWGWGNGSKQKALIEPFINSLCNIASDYIVTGDIENIKNSCLDELNATFYTDEDKIIEKVEILINAVICEINKKYQRLEQETKYF